MSSICPPNILRPSSSHSNAGVNEDKNVRNTLTETHDSEHKDNNKNP